MHWHYPVCQSSHGLLGSISVSTNANWLPQYIVQIAWLLSPRRKRKCTFVCQYVVPPGECYYNTVLRCGNPRVWAPHTQEWGFNLLTFRHHGTQDWAPECPNVKQLLKCGLDQYGAECFATLIFATVRKSVGLKRLNNIKTFFLTYCLQVTLIRWQKHSEFSLRQLILIKLQRSKRLCAFACVHSP